MYFNVKRTTRLYAVVSKKFWNIELCLYRLSSGTQNKKIRCTKDKINELVSIPIARCKFGVRNVIHNTIF